MKSHDLHPAVDKALERVRSGAAELMTRHAVASSTPMRECLVALNRLSGETMTLFVVDEEGRMAGTMTDGDIRRAIIGGASVSDTAESLMHRDFMALTPPDTPWKKIAEARRRGITLLPRLDAEGYVQDIMDLRLQHSALPVDAVLMAGGRGERLRPLTLTTPKPLLKVGGKPIIDYNVEELRANGIEKIRVTVNYLKEQLIDHFSHPRFGGYVECVEEPRRLGTMGSLSLVGDLTNDFVLVMNSDILTTLDFEKLYLAHIESGAALTMAVIPYTVSVPFSIIRTEGDRVTGLTEKPTYNYFAGAGVYLMDRRLMARISPGEYLDAPDFVESLIVDGLKVGYFPIDGTWIDIGSPDDYRYADELMSRPVQ
ncbi:MAG: NTP transferase domain-containing protein [Muribaculaceae bacterium]|nr:NTP transferase domain-containing protein [Muribaculaceae bacterium]